MAVWTYYIARDLKPEMLDDMPDSCGNTYAALGAVNEFVEERVNGENSVSGSKHRKNQGVAASLLHSGSGQRRPLELCRGEKEEKPEKIKTGTSRDKCSPSWTLF